MEIEFNAVSEDDLRQICNNHGFTSAEILPLSRRDAICPREEGRQFSDGQTYYLAEESCWHGYYYCGDYRCCYRTSSYRASGAPRIKTSPSVRGRTSRRSGDSCSNLDCSGANCDAGSDSAGALMIFIIVIALFLLLIFLAPYIGPMIALGIELGLAFLLALFDILTFGLFRKKFKRVLVYFPTPPSDNQLRSFIIDVASMGGLPRRYLSSYYTNGFLLLRTGAYLFIPSLIATFLVLLLPPENGFLFRMPIVTFIISILCIWFGNYFINRKTAEVASRR